MPTEKTEIIAEYFLYTNCCCIEISGGLQRRRFVLENKTSSEGYLERSKAAGHESGG